MKALLLTLIATCLPFTASAAPVSFSFDERFNYTNDSYAFESEEGGDFVSVSAHSTRGDAYLAGWDYGLSIFTCTRICYDQHLIEGRGPDEYVFVDFGQEVELTSLSFSYVDSYDDFTLRGEGFDLIADDVAIGSGGGQYWDVATYLFTSSVVGSSFYIGADYRDDNFKLSGLGANTIAAVPIPSALWLMASGLAGIGLLRRRKS